ncbi:MAG: glutamate synthase subunit beta [Frankiaceae bacterium]|nr:glutamate synthase subunit beta [Frankiaceae bacterium]MBV9869822.1 glutamate synthase subunit beta [Frankiaceae bacterium]
MADPKGFLTTPRETPTRRPVDIRLQDWREVYEDFEAGRLQKQAGRCMDCGIPFCHQGCPLGNLIPEWNDLVWRDDWREAIERLHATNNFPEFTGRLCPAPCEASCVLGINQDPVTIKQVEVEIVDRAWDEGWIAPQIAERLSGKTVGVVGSGPAGLAVAQQLTRAGHTVVVYERADRIGGLLRYGIPEFKMEKRHLELRLLQMEEEGTRFRAGVNVGVDITAEQLRKRHDAIVLAGGSTIPRDLDVPGRELTGIYPAMDYLPLANRVQQGDLEAPPISAEGKDVIILGGGDTGADCLGTALRQGAKSVTQLEILQRPPEQRNERMPWPTYPMIYRISSAHEEGGERVYAVSTQRFDGDESGNVSALVIAEVDEKFNPIEGTERVLPAQLVLLAMGFLGPEQGPLVKDLEVEIDGRGNVARSAEWMTNLDGVFVCGDMGRGQSLIVWAIAEGRSCASAVDRFLLGDSQLPAPVQPTDRPIA